MDSSAAASPYRPLSLSEPDQIRLVKLYPARHDDAVRCLLEHVSLNELEDDAIPYTALSYTWGDPALTAPIILNEIQQCPVTLNLHSFLRHMQHILLAVVTFVPARFREQNDHSRLLLHLTVRSVLNDFEFPDDFLATSDSDTYQLVRRHVRKVLVEGGVEPDPDTLDEVVAELERSQESCEACDCYLRFWIDAICINQQDLHEKSQQVGMMKDIYSRAPAMLIWLESTDLTASDIKAVANLFRDIHSAIQPHLDGYIAWEDFRACITSDTFLQPRLQEMYLLRKILTQKWFSRVWIIQEAVTAANTATVLVRFQPLNWRFLTHVVSECCEIMLSSSSDTFAEWVMFSGDAKNMITLREVTRDYAETMASGVVSMGGVGTSHGGDVAMRLRGLLRLVLGKFQATEPRDILYALLGLLGRDDFPPEIAPDYTKPLNEVFRQYVTYLIRGTGDLEFLRCYKRGIQDGPSWVPDWRYCYVEKAAVGSTTSRPAHRVEVSEDGMCLEVDAIIVGKVVSAVFPTSIAAGMRGKGFFEGGTNESGRVMTDDEDTRAFAADILTIFRGLQSLKRMCLQSLWEASPNVPIDDFQYHWEQFWPGYKDDRFHTLFEMMEEKKAVDLAELVSGAAGALLVGMRSEILKLAERGLGISHDATMVELCRTDEPIRVGDTISILDGISSPCILRKSDSQYAFVGVCGTTSMSSDYQRGSYRTQRIVLV